MTNYEPGAVAIATVRGVPNVRVFRYHGRNWISAETVGEPRLRSRLHSNEQVTDIRPLIVLDLDYLRFLSGAGQPAVIEHLRRHVATAPLAEQIEAQTKPPRIPEPTGFAPVVEAGVAQHDVRLQWSRNEQGFWFCKDSDEYARNWGELIDPTLVRPGV
jgi:hypothetical protein